MNKSILRKKTGNTIRNRPHSKYIPTINQSAGFNLNKAKNWELTMYDEKPIIYHTDESHSRRYGHERYGLGFNLATQQSVKMGLYRQCPVALDACLIGVTNQHFRHCDRTSRYEYRAAHRQKKDRNNDKHSQKMKIKHNLCQTLQESE